MTCRNHVRLGEVRIELDNQAESRGGHESIHDRQDVSQIPQIEQGNTHPERLQGRDSADT